MTPDQVAGFTAIAAIMKQVGTWPIGTLIAFVVIGPWVISLVLSRSQEKRFEAVREMYENNVDLVKSFEKVNMSLLDCVLVNTNKWTEVSEKIDMNQFCPLARIRKQRMEDVQ